MKSERLFHFALRQTLLIAAVCAAIPVAALVATVLLATLSELLCEQLPALMTLSVVVTASTLGVKLFRTDTNGF